MVSLQQSSTLSDDAKTYNSDISTVQQFVSNTLYYTPEFIWNMTWAWPTAPLREDFTLEQQTQMYNNIVSAVQTKIVPNNTFKLIMPVGVAVQNANSVLEDADLYCDRTHINAFARIMAAYVWYCQLENVDPANLAELKIAETPAAFSKIHGAEDEAAVSHSEAFMAIALEAVRNALITGRDNTFTVTDLTPPASE